MVRLWVRFPVPIFFFKFKVGVISGFLCVYLQLKPWFLTCEVDQDLLRVELREGLSKTDGGAPGCAWPQPVPSAAEQPLLRVLGLEEKSRFRRFTGIRTAPKAQQPPSLSPWAGGRHKGGVAPVLPVPRRRAGRLRTRLGVSFLTGKAGPGCPQRRVRTGTGPLQADWTMPGEGTSWAWPGG